MAEIDKVQQTEDLVEKKKADAEQVYNQANDVSGDSWADELMSDDVRKQPKAPKKVQSAPKGTGDTWADAMMSDDVRNTKQPVNVEQPVEQNTQPAPVQQVENVDNNLYKGEDLGEITVTLDKGSNKQDTTVEQPTAQAQPQRPVYDYTKAPEWKGEPDTWKYTRTIKTYNESHPLAQAARHAKQYGDLLSAGELSAVYANKDWDDLNRQSQELMRNNPTRPKGGTPQFEHDAQLLSAIHNQMVALEYNFADRNDMYRNIGQKNYRMFLEPMRKGNKYTEFYENLYNSGANLRNSNPLLLDLPDKVEAQRAADEKAGKKKPDNYYFNMALKDKDFKERYHAWSFFGSIQDNMGWNEYKNLGAKASDLREERYKEESAKRFAESSLYAPVSALLDNSVAQAVMAVGNAYDVIKGQPLRSESVNDLLQRSMKYAGEGKNVTRGVLSFIPEAVSIMPVTGVAATKAVGALSKVFTFTPRAMKLTTGGLSFMGFEMAKSALGSWSQGREIDWAEMAGNSAKGFLLGAGGSLISEGVAGIKPNINSTVANYAIQGAGKVAETGLFASTEMAMAYLGNDKEATWTSSLLNNGALIISMAIGYGIGNGFGFKSRIGNATIEKVRKAGYNTLANEMAKHTQAVERGAMPKGYSQAAIEEMQSMQQSMGSNGLSWSDYAEVLKPINSKMTKPGTNSIEKVEDGKGYRIVSYDVNGVEIERSKVYDEWAVDKEFAKRQRAVEKKREEANVKSFDLMRDSTIKAKAARSVADRINFDDGKSVYNGDGTVNEAFDGITADDVLYAYEALSEKPAEQRSSDEARIVALFDEAVRDYGEEMPDSNAVKKTLCVRYGVEESAFDAAWKADAKDRKGREAEICATYNSIMSRPYEVALNGGEAGAVDGRQVVIKSAVKTDAEGMPLDPNQRVYYDDGTGVKVTTAEHVLMEPTVEDPGTLGDRIANENLRKALEAKKEALKSMFAEIPTDVLESNLDIARTAIENGEDTDGSMRLTYIALEEEIQRRRDLGVEETIAPTAEESAPIEIDADGNVIEGEEAAPIEINERGEVVEKEPVEAPKPENEIKPVAVPEVDAERDRKIDELLDFMGFEGEERATYREHYESHPEDFDEDYSDYQAQKGGQGDMPKNGGGDDIQQEPGKDDMEAPMPKDEKGKVAMRKASTSRTRKYLYEDLGLSKEDADSIVDYELEKATKAQQEYEKATKRPTIRDKGIDGDPEKLKQKLDEYDKAAQAAQEDVRYWEEVKRMGEEPAEPESEPKPSTQNAGEANTVGNEVKEKWNNAPKAYGKSDTMRLENGTKLNGRYVLAPSGSASASHDANNNYNQTPGFPVDGNGNTANSRDYRGNASYRETTERHAESYNENAIQDRVVVSKDGVVLSGNGRTMAGELAARHNTDKEYVDYLREHAEDFGFTKEQVDSMEHPRVLFEVQEDLPYTAETFDMFNKGKEKVENKTESAVRLGKTTPPETISRVLEIIDQFDNIGEFNNNNQAPIDVLRELASAGVITQNEINALLENGKLSPQGKDFIENLLVGNIFAGDPDAVRILSNNADVRQKVVTGLSALTGNARLGGGYSLVDEITTAIKLIANEREGNLERGSTMQAITTSFDFGEDYGSTPTEAFTNQLVITLTEMLNGKRVREFKEFLDSYNNEAEVSAGGETRMFGNLGTKEEIFNFIIDNFKNGRYKKSRDARTGAGQGEAKRAGDEEAGAGPENPRADEGQEVGDEGDTRFRDGEGDAGVAEPEDGNAPTFYSNAARAVENIKQNKATAEQWKAMLTKAGGIKAGEDKWMGLSEWLEENKGKSLTKDEVLQFVRDNGIKMEEVNYGGVRWETLNDGSMTIEGHPEIEVRPVVGTPYYDYYYDGKKAARVASLDVALEHAKNDIVDDDVNRINPIRERYTTNGLENNREIAFKLPNVEPYQEHDEIHFGPENQGKAVMWVRFGETTDADGKRVLVIDEIQSNRHQDAREKGYVDTSAKTRYDEARKAYMDYGRELAAKYNVPEKFVFTSANDTEKKQLRTLLKEQQEAKRLYDENYGIHSKAVPAAPFEKNWHEVAMKRMLRLAAEEGFDKVAWTTGEQQAERYSLGRMYDSIEREDNPSIDGKRFVLSGRNMDTFLVNKEGNIEDSSFSEFNGKPLSDVVGKELAERMMNLEDGDIIEGEQLNIGGEGMKGFYDKMLPRFMDKYGKRWGVKTGEVQLATPGKEVMHSVDVTPEMKESVMQGQPLFRQQEPMGERGVKKVTVVNEPEYREGTDYFGRPTTHRVRPGQYKVEGYDDIFNSVEEVADFMRKKNPDYCVYIDEDGNIGYEAWSNILPEGMKPNTYAKILASNGGKLSSAMKKRIERYTQREMKQARVRAEEITKELGLDVEFHDDPSEFSGRKSRAKGWYDPKTGKIHIVMGNHSGVSDVMATMLHEGVAHHGLRKLFGEDFDTFLDNVHNNVSEDIRTDINDRIEKMRAADQEGAHSDEYYRRAATEEYLADLAEDGLYNGEQNTGYASRAWQWIKENFINMLRKAGINIELSDDELRYILWSSHKNLRRGAEAMAKDAIMREKAGIKEYVEDGEPVSKVAESGRQMSLFPEGNTRSLGGAREMRDAELLEEISKDRYDVRSTYTDEYDRRHNREYNENYDSTTMMLEDDNTSIEQVEEMLIDAAYYLRNNYTSKERAVAKARFDAIQDYYFSKEAELEKARDDFFLEHKDELKERFGDYYDEEENIDKLMSEYGLARESRVPYGAVSEAREILRGENPRFRDGEEEGPQSDLAARLRERMRQRMERARGANNGGEEPHTESGSSGGVVPPVEPPTPPAPGSGADDPNLTPQDRSIARDNYEKTMHSSRFQMTEALQDSMLSLKKLMQSIIGKKGFRIENVAGFENPYIAENRMSSANNAQHHDYYVRYMKPLFETISNLTGGKKKARAELTDYMMAKHGLERNEKLAERDALAAAKKGADFDAEFEKNRERDYSGLTALTGEKEVDAAEAKARQVVADYEAQHNTTDLWQNVKAATRATLDKMHDSGLLSQERYDSITQMFENYIPLQGWDEKTNRDVYGFLTSHDGPLSSPIKKAKGRSSKADDPIAVLWQMSDQAIQQGNRNVMKQTFLTFVRNHPSDAVSLSDLWLKHNDVTDVWEPVFADISPDDTPADVARKVEAFNQKLEQLEQQYPDVYKRGEDAENIPYKVVPGSIGEHQVVVKEKGRSYVLTINGNPRAAQAINGKTNPDNPSGWVGSFLNGVAKFNRSLSYLYTSANPAFVGSNWVRDAIYSNSMTWMVKDSPNYAAQFSVEWGKLNPVYMRTLYHSWQNGTLDTSKKYGKLFEEFMLNGGETGYMSSKEIEKYKRDIKKEIRRAGSDSRRIMHIFGRQLEMANRAVENNARFAAYCASRNTGRSVERSIYDAKEVSVNFNKKGAGGRMIGATGQTAAGNTAAFIGGAGRSLYVFWNPAIQGLTNIGRAYRRAPVRAIMHAASLFSMGMAAAWLNQNAPWVDDEDREEYYNMPDYIRRSNFCIPLGDKKFLTIPMVYEMRALYGLGELATSVLSGNERYSDKELAYTIASLASQTLPLDMLEGGGGLNPFVPSTVKPFYEAGKNKGWTGLPLYKDTPWNKDDPEWTKTYKNANRWLMEGSRWLNEFTRGDDFKKGWLDVNPAQVEYILRGYGGGFFEVADKLTKMTETAFGDRDFDWSNMLVASRFVKQANDRTELRKLNNDFYKYKEEYEKTKKLLKNYNEAANGGKHESPIDYAEKIAFLHDSKEYGRFLIYGKYAKELDELNDVRKGLEDGTLPEDMRKEYDERELELKRQIVQEMHDFEDGKASAQPERASVQEMMQPADLERKQKVMRHAKTYKEVRSYNTFSKNLEGFKASNNAVVEKFQGLGCSFKFSEDGKYFDMEDYTYKVPAKDEAKRAKAMEYVKEHKAELRRVYRCRWREQRIKKLIEEAAADSSKEEENYKKILQLAADDASDSVGNPKYDK